jgi:hypothetical protein
MAVDFSERRLSRLPSSLVGCLSGPFLVDPSLTRILYSGRVPFVPPVEEPDAEPVDLHRAVSNEELGPEFRSVGLFQASEDGTAWGYVGEDPDLRNRDLGGHRVFERVLRLVLDGKDAGEVSGGKFWIDPRGRGVAHQEAIPHPSEPQVRHARIVLNGEPGPVLLAVRKAAWSVQGVFAYTGDLSVGGGARVFVAGEPGPVFPRVEDLLWSPDGLRLALVASEDGVKRKLLVNGKAEPVQGEPFRVTFSPDGKRLAYAGFADGGCRIVVDGEAGPKVDGCLGLEFSPDGRRHAAVVVSGGRQAVAVNHRAGKAYDDVGGPLMNRDGTLVAHGAGEAGAQFVVVNGEESERADLVFRLAVASEAPAAAWVLKKGRSYRIFHQGRLVRETAERVGALVLGRDGRTLAWIEGGRLHVDGAPAEAVDALEEPVFAPDGRTPVYRARIGGEPHLVVGGTTHGPMRVLSPFAFSPEGDRVACVVLAGDEVWRKVFPLR